MVSAARLLRALGALALSLSLASCLDGPFARHNPNDPGADVTLTLVASQDTIRLSNPYVLVQVVSDPPTVGYRPLWRLEPAGTLNDLGDGLFSMSVPPGAPAPTTIFAEFQARTLSITIIRAP